MGLREQMQSDRVQEIHMITLAAAILRAGDVSERVAVRIVCDLLEEAVKEHKRRFED